MKSSIRSQNARRTALECSKVASIQRLNRKSEMWTGKRMGQVRIAKFVPLDLLIFVVILSLAPVAYARQESNAIPGVGHSRETVSLNGTWKIASEGCAAPINSAREPSILT